jgi:hypothetical protein
VERKVERKVEQRITHGHEEDKPAPQPPDSNLAMGSIFGLERVLVGAKFPGDAKHCHAP